MNALYNICFCGSNNKFKFCCYKTIQTLDTSKITQALANLPIIFCYIGKNWQNIGMTDVLIVRKIPNDNFILSIYLVDLWCLGVKNTFNKINIDTKKLQFYCMNSWVGNGELISISYQDARSLVLGSAEYAKSLGFNPHKDWEKTKYFVDYELPFENKFEFGKDGKPFYVAGPYDEFISNQIIE